MYNLDLLEVSRYTIIAHHIIKKRNRLLKENALLGAQFEACITCDTVQSLVIVSPNSLYVI